MLEFRIKRELKKDPQIYVGKQFSYDRNTYWISGYDALDDKYVTRCGKFWTGTEEFFKCIIEGTIQIIP